MATNPYFDNYNIKSEQDLMEDLVIESIQMKGIDCHYLPRSQKNLDKLFNEDSSSVFKESGIVEMYPTFVEGFDGDNMMSHFELTMDRTGTFVVSKKRFEEEFPEIKRPKAGDLIYMPVTNSVLEITNIDKDSPFFERGKQYIYNVSAILFTHSYEDIQTETPQMDNLMSKFKINTPDIHVEEYGDNDYFDEVAKESVDFDPLNPFGSK